jgi:uncharacterized protein YdiU (UPF0061 family)
MFNFDTTYQHLPKQLFEPALPVNVAHPQCILFNTKLAAELGLSELGAYSTRLATLFSGNVLAPGSEPLAQAYAGRQFGHFTMLGDGRAILLGEQITPSGNRVDIQLKGAGQTPYSRRGDGRAALGPMLREYIISEAMHGLGIPTTRSLAVVTTGETVRREIPLQGAILTRVAASHIRVGTFEYAAAIEEPGVLKALADYTLNRHYPELSSDTLNNPDRYSQFLSAVVDRQARLIAKWMLVGFVHGVMNTDNMAISGETIDYGPCAFMDTYHAATVFSSIDTHGRYSFENQPAIAQWNLARFAETLLPLLSTAPEESIRIANAALQHFVDTYREAWISGMRAKLGLSVGQPEDPSLIQDLLSLMQTNKRDFTQTFTALQHRRMSPEVDGETSEERDWINRWKNRVGSEQRGDEVVAAQMASSNPRMIPRNHLVEEALATATVEGTLAKVERLVEVLRSPFADKVEDRLYHSPPIKPDPQYRTFCGT